MLASNGLLLAQSFGTPRIDFSLHMGTVAFMILCGALVTAIIASVVVLGLYSERRKREAAHHDTWIEESDQYRDDDAEPFVPDEAKPDAAPASKASEPGEDASTQSSKLSPSQTRKLTEVAFG